MADKGRKKLEDYLLIVSKILEDFQKKSVINSYALIGGLAVGAIGIPRATKDVDFLVSAGNAEALNEHLESVFDKKHYKLKYEKSEGNVFPYHNIICSIKDKAEEVRIIDLLISTRNWQEEISKYTVRVNYSGRSIPIVNTEGLIILKLKAGGPMDIIDVNNILMLIDVKKLDDKILFDWAKRAGVNKLLSKMLKEKKWTK